MRVRPSSPGTAPASVLAPHSGASRGLRAQRRLGGRAVGLRARGLEGRHLGGGTAAGSTTAGTARFPVDHGVDSALRQREIFGAADYPARDLGHDDRPAGARRGPAPARRERLGRDEGQPVRHLLRANRLRPVPSTRWRILSVSRPRHPTTSRPPIAIRDATIARVRRVGRHRNDERNDQEAERSGRGVLR